MSSASFKTIVRITKIGFDEGYGRRAYWLLSALLETVTLVLVISTWLSAGFYTALGNLRGAEMTDAQAAIILSCTSSSTMLLMIQIVGVIKSTFIIFLLRKRIYVCPSTHRKMDERIFSVSTMLVVMMLHSGIFLALGIYKLRLHDECALGIMNALSVNILCWGGFASVIAFLIILLLVSYCRSLTRLTSSSGQSFV